MVSCYKLMTKIIEKSAKWKWTRLWQGDHSHNLRVKHCGYGTLHIARRHSAMEMFNINDFGCAKTAACGFKHSQITKNTKKIVLLRMTLKNNRAPFLCYFKHCAAFRSHWWIQTGVTVRKCPILVKMDDYFCRVTLKSFLKNNHIHQCI